MNKKMKIINMRLCCHQQLQNFKEGECSSLISYACERQLSKRILQIFNQYSNQKCQAIKQIINQQTLLPLAKIAEFFIQKNRKFTKLSETQKFQQNHTYKLSKDLNQKLIRKIEQMNQYIERMKSKLVIKNVQLKQRDILISNLKKQCQSLKIIMRKQKVLKQLISNSSILLNNLNVEHQPFKQNKDIQLDLSSQNKQNIFYRTSYESQRPCWDESQKKNLKSQTYTQFKSNKRHLNRRQIRKTIDKLTVKGVKNQNSQTQKQQISRWTALSINQKQIVNNSQLFNRKLINSRK